MKRTMKRFVGLVAVVLLVCALATTAFARDIDGGTITKITGEEGVYYRLPRLVDSCPNCGNTLREFIPDPSDYTNMKYTVTGDAGIADVKFSIGTWPSGEYAGYPCLKVTYKATKAGNATVKISFSYSYNVAGEVGYCNFCGRRVSCSANYTTYTDNITYTIAVEDPVTPTPTIEPATPTPTIEPATPTPTIEPATPTPTIEPATPTPTIDPVTPTPTVEPVVPTEVPPQVYPTPTPKVEESVEPTVEPTEEPTEEPGAEVTDDPIPGVDEPGAEEDGEIDEDDNNDIPRTGDPTQFAFAIVLALTGIAVAVVALRRSEKR